MTIYKISILTMILMFVSLVQAQIGQQGTAFPESGKNYVYLLSANNDLYGIKKNATGTKSTEVHILASSGGYKTFKLQTGTPLEETNDNYDFLLAPNNDLVAIKKFGTGTRKTEVHILSASSNYQQFILQTGTALPETNNDHRFLMDAERNLYVINRKGLRSTTIQILSAASNYQKASFTEMGLPLSQTDERFNFLLDSDKNLITVIKQDTGKIVIIVFKRDMNYQLPSPLSGTFLGFSGDNFQFLINLQNDIFGIKTSQTGTKSTEVHILSAITKYSQFGLTLKPSQPNPTVTAPTAEPNPTTAPPSVPFANTMEAIQKIGKEFALFEEDVRNGKITDQKLIETKRKEYEAKLNREINKPLLAQWRELMRTMKEQIKNSTVFPDQLKADFYKGLETLDKITLDSFDKSDLKAKEFNRNFANGVKIFEGVNLQGNSAAFGVGTFTANNGPINGIGNDAASSVQVPAGYIVKLCPEEGDNRQGAGNCEEYREGTHNLKSPRTASWVNVRLIDLPQLPEQFQKAFLPEGLNIANITFGEFGVQIFEGRDFQGKSAIFGNGTFIANNGPINGLGNDSASSVIVPKGFMVKFCGEEGNSRQGAGTCEEYGEGKHNLKHDNQMSWVKVWIP